MKEEKYVSVDKTTFPIEERVLILEQMVEHLMKQISEIKNHPNVRHEQEWYMNQMNMMQNQRNSR